jgi:phosphate transport system protein
MKHLRYELDKDETLVQKKLMRLGEMTVKAISNAFDCVQRWDTDAAAAVVNADANINEQQRIIEEACLVAIATQQPVAGDLRVIVANMHIAEELERIADHAADIARLVVRAGDEKCPLESDNISRMAERCSIMLQQVMEAYANRDDEQAMDIAAQDNVLDKLHEDAVNNLISEMCSDAGLVLCKTSVMWIAHNLERIGDRVTNISERIIFMTSGKNLDLNR